MSSHTLTSTFHTRAEADHQEIDRKAHDIARHHFPNVTYSMSVDVTDVCSIAGNVLHKTVTVTVTR